MRVFASVEYPCFRSGEPRRIPAAAIARMAAEFRSHLFGIVVRPIDLAALMRRASRIRVNGHDLRIAWDCDHAVHDADDQPVLGICEHDPSEPGTVLISLNGNLLEGRPELLRSTAAHELGHAVFDMPAAMLTQSAR